MTQPSFKDAITICKTIMRNGFDAHIVNTPLQHKLIAETGIREIDIATDISPDELSKIFPQAVLEDEDSQVIATFTDEEDYLYRFYAMPTGDSVAPEVSLIRHTPTIAARMAKLENAMPAEAKRYAPFEDFALGMVKFINLPDETLQKDYSLAIKAFRYSANFDLPIEQNTWVAILRATQRIIDYVPPFRIMEEWKKVAAENMWVFIKLLCDSQVIYGILPEIAGLARVRQTKNDTGVEESVLEHTLNCVKAYPQGELGHDWFGTFAMLFHDVGKLYTAEYYQNRWTFYEHHRIGSRVTRIILRRLRMTQDEIDLVCGLVRNHMRFEFMMTDRGIRRFKSQPEYTRLIEMARANIIAREDNYTAFNHNNKYLARAETPEQMLEPFLNGNEIMEVTGLQPGPHVGVLRQALLKAQIAGTVKTLEEATDFVRQLAHETGD